MNNWNNQRRIFLTSPGSASSVAMYSSNHSLMPPKATLTSAIDFFEPPATFARMLRTSNFVSYRICTLWNENLWCKICKTQMFQAFRCHISSRMQNISDSKGYQSCKWLRLKRVFYAVFYIDILMTTGFQWLTFKVDCYNGNYVFVFDFPNKP